jgi:hypothetical protein
MRVCGFIYRFCQLGNFRTSSFNMLFPMIRAPAAAAYQASSRLQSARFKVQESTGNLKSRASSGQASGDARMFKHTVQKKSLNF